MRKTIQELREERGESRADLPAALGVTLDEVTEWELGKAEPGLSRVRTLTEHFGVWDDQIHLRPADPPSISDRLAVPSKAHAAAPSRGPGRMMPVRGYQVGSCSARHAHRWKERRRGRTPVRYSCPHARSAAFTAGTPRRAGCNAPCRA